jgi:hypothetical protein
MPRRLGLLLLLGAALSLPAPRVALAAPTTPQHYVFEADEAKAAKMLETLLARYGRPTRHASLLKALRGRRRTPRHLKDQDTISYVCSDGKTRTFTYLLPPKYRASKPAPLMIWLHGAIRQPAPGGGAGEAALFRPVVADLGFIVLGPSTYDGVEWGSVACRGLVRHALAWLEEHCNVDENRVYLCGDSDGGRGTYALCETEAGALAAAVPVIGAPGGVTRFLNLRNLPIFAINGGKDSIFEIDHVRSAVEGMKAAGIPLTWKLLPDGHHDPRCFLTHRDEVRDFLRKHVRDPYPHALDWCVDPARKDPGHPASDFRWVRIEEVGTARHESTFDDARGLLANRLPRVHASYEGNRVELRTRGVKRVTVLVSDQMLDLHEDVEVGVNGRTLFRGRVGSDARVILEEARRFRDRHLVFSNRITLDVDAAPVPSPKDGAPK